jgi:hypothetical protein
MVILWRKVVGVLVSPIKREEKMGFLYSYSIDVISAGVVYPLYSLSYYKVGP